MQEGKRKNGTESKKRIENSKKIVIKIGSNVLSDENGVVDKKVLHNIAEQVNDLISMGKQVILVSSGAGDMRCRRDQQVEPERWISTISRLCARSVRWS